MWPPTCIYVCEALRHGHIFTELVASRGEQGHLHTTVCQGFKLESWHCLQPTLLPPTSHSIADHTVSGWLLPASYIPSPFARTLV